MIDCRVIMASGSQAETRLTPLELLGRSVSKAHAGVVEGSSGLPKMCTKCVVFRMKIFLK